MRDKLGGNHTDDLHKSRDALIINESWFVLGNRSLLEKQNRIGFISSRSCPSYVIAKAISHVPNWANEGRLIISGFHSPLEQQIFQSLARRNGYAVKILARGLTSYRATALEHEALNNDRMLVASPFAPDVRRTTRASALERNRLVLALADEIFVAHLSENSPLCQMIAEESRRRPNVIVTRLRKVD